MKKLTFVIVAAISLAASAAWQKAGSIQVADAQAFTKAVMKLGEISGNQMLGAMAAGFLAEPPGSKFFGPMRPNSTALLPVFFDDSALDKGFDKLGDAVKAALIYPMSINRAEFLKLHPGAVETNGMICVKGKITGDEDDDDDDGGLIYVAFTPDGKWAVVGDKPEQIALAMGSVSCAERPLEGALVRACLAPQGMSAVRKLVDNLAAEAKKSKEPFDDSVLELLAGIDSFWLGLGVSDLGLDFMGGVKPVPGTEMAKIGAAALPDAPFAFAGADAIMASADFTLDKGNVLEKWKPFEDAIKRNGLDISRFLKITYAGGTTKIVYDTPALAKYMASEATNSLAKIDSEKLVNDVKAVMGSSKAQPIRVAAVPQNGMMVMVGYKPKFTVAQRFEATLPDAKGRRLVTAGVFSLSALVQAVLPSVMSIVPEEERAEIQPMLAFLPQESAGGCATMSWCEKGSIRFISRISADELKGIGTAAAGIMAFTAAQQMQKK